MQVDQIDEEAHAPHDESVANYYGIWPMIIGFAFGAALIWFMFAYADGFA